MCRFKAEISVNHYFRAVILIFQKGYHGSFYAIFQDGSQTVHFIIKDYQNAI